VTTNFLTDLNEQQRRAVKIDTGPILILAGAGSGKTRVITYRIAHLIAKKKTHPRNILAVTFTNKAADEMRSRISSMLNNDDHKIWIKTFHSTCAKILRTAAEHIDIPRNFTIYDEHDQLSLIRECFHELNIDSKDVSPGVVVQAISRVKENLQSPRSIKNEFIRKIYKYYNKKLSEYNALDFDDLIMKVVEVFKRDEEILQYYQTRFQYIMVDEYQDTNRAQYELTKLLAAEHRNLCVVGDDDQSIYSWRGAEIKNILDFEKDFPDAVVIKLEQNYRSTKTILNAASSVVKHNTQRKPKVLWCEADVGEKIEFFEAVDGYTEATYVARKIMECKLQGASLGDIAVFYRINYQSRNFEECFVQHRIPYEVIGSLKFYERAEIKTVLAYLNVINNLNDCVSLKRIINAPSRKIGYQTIEKIVNYQQKHRISFFEALQHIDRIENLSSATKERIREFLVMMETFFKSRDTMDLYEFVLMVVKDSGYLESLSQDKTEREYARKKNVEELLISIKDYVKQRPETTLQDYLEDVSLRSDIDEWNASCERVNLMTLHNAKGLEFDYVFITGLEDGLIPHYKSQYEEKQYEEERRLLYVGITRARKKLFLSYARQRDIFRGDFNYTKLSPFFKEIPTDVFATTLETD
jgi:DNA helicase-2/ATP-dependent DNA helicase PcrA